ncbi:hypothetical protein [Streptomyces sp. 8P21H-1]|uniref:hypothetical protein n=1 Tax=Streptomyces sp. 8P21H-1 TaxID=2737048 RepID=UPI001C2D4713|nr:hypothetical protein [Streptomyces sp. 8P21H-1]
MFALHLLLWHEYDVDLTLPQLHADTALGRAMQATCQPGLTAALHAPPALVLPFDFEFRPVRQSRSQHH